MSKEGLNMTKKIILNSFKYAIQQCLKISQSLKQQILIINFFKKREATLSFSHYNAETDCYEVLLSFEKSLN